MLFLRIVVVSRSWPSHDRSGLPIAASMHVKCLAEAGHSVIIIGSSSSIFLEDLPVLHRLHIPAHGSGALYSPTKIDLCSLETKILGLNPDIVLVESLQTALTDGTILACNKLNIPVLLISHGISVSLYNKGITSILRSLAWLPYRFIVLPRLLNYVSAMTTLSTSSNSERFLDRDIAKQYGKPIFYLPNSPHHLSKDSVPRHNRLRQILVIGYFSYIKNQKQALQLLSKLNCDQASLLFIGNRAGSYYRMCVSLAQKLGISHRTRFMTDSDVSISFEISRSYIVLSTSITEVLSLVLLEAMASGTPFVATDVGANSELRGGIVTSSFLEQLDAIQSLFDNPVLWDGLSRAGRSHYKSDYTLESVRHCLNRAVISTYLMNARR